jgi:alpha-L-fucosidase
MVLNVPGRPDGTVDSKEIAVLDAFTAWMQPNGEAIYDTRPWKVFGEGPGKLDTREFKGDSIKKPRGPLYSIHAQQSQHSDLCFGAWLAGR